MVGCDGEQVCDAGGYLVEKGLLRFAEGGFGEEFEVLDVIVRI